MGVGLTSLDLADIAFLQQIAPKLCTDYSWPTGVEDHLELKCPSQTINFLEMEAANLPAYLTEPLLFIWGMVEDFNPDSHPHLVEKSRTLKIWQNLTF